MYDCIALGEVMLRFDPGDTRIAAADRFTVWEGGGEYNVVRGLSACFGKRTAIVTALADNPIGKLIETRIAAGRVDTGLIRWFDDDGIGESCRNGIYFLEKGFGMRAAIGMSDRGHSAISQLKPGDIDWHKLFETHPTRWFHTGGIMAGLSPDSPLVIMEAMRAARDIGATVSYDLNYRASLWQRFGGKKKADEINKRILPLVDVLFGVGGLESSPKDVESGPFVNAIQKIADEFPALKTISSTMRIVKTATINDWSGILFHEGAFFEGVRFENLEIYDRVGGGDSFAAGVIYGLLEGLDKQKTINYGVVHGALTMTTPGDNSMFSLAELDRYLAEPGAGVVR